MKKKLFRRTRFVSVFEKRTQHLTNVENPVRVRYKHALAVQLYPAAVGPPRPCSGTRLSRRTKLGETDFFLAGEGSVVASRPFR